MSVYLAEMTNSFRSHHIKAHSYALSRKETKNNKNGVSSLQKSRKNTPHKQNRSLAYIYLWAIITVHLRYKELLKTTNAQRTGNMTGQNRIKNFD